MTATAYPFGMVPDLSLAQSYNTQGFTAFEILDGVVTDSANIPQRSGDVLNTDPVRLVSLDGQPIAISRERFSSARSSQSPCVVGKAQ